VAEFSRREEIMTDSPHENPDAEIVDAGTPGSGAPDTNTAEILEQVREDRLANAVEELMAEDEGSLGQAAARAEAWEGHEEALRAEYQQATRPTPEDIEQPPLVKNPPSEGPLVDNPPPEVPLIQNAPPVESPPADAPNGPIEVQPAIHPTAAAVGTAALEVIDALFANSTGVPEAASTLIRAVVNAIEAHSVEGIKAKTATAVALTAIDLAVQKSNVPGTDPNAAEVIKSLKEYVPAAAENYLGEPPTDQEDSADR
jgi:hypothetical protein